MFWMSHYNGSRRRFFIYLFFFVILHNLKIHSLFLAEKGTKADDKEKEMKQFNQYFSVFFSKLVLFMKKRNEKISFEVKKKKLYFVCCYGMMANYKKMIRGQNINRKRRNKTNGRKPADILTKERRKSYQMCPVQAISIFMIY